MTKYEYYQHEKEYCEEMAKQNKNDPALYTFYINAAAGFEIKKNKLSVTEAAE